MKYSGYKAAPSLPHTTQCEISGLGALRRAGVAVNVADGIHEAKMIADDVTAAAGGHGAVREVAELILRAQNHWSKIMGHFSR